MTADATKSSRRVIVGIGDGEKAVRLLVWAVEEARRLGAELHAVRAWLDVSPAAGTEVWPHLLALAARESIAAQFQAACGEVPKDIVIRMVGGRGSAGEVLARYADREDDLLVLGPPRRSWWPFTGGTVRRCLRRATCPVVVVPAGGDISTRKLLRELRRDMKRFEREGASAS